MTPILPHLLPFTTPHLSFFLPSTPSLSLPSPHYSISTPVYRLGDRRVRVSVPYEQQGGGDAEAVRPHARVLRPSHQVICHAFPPTHPLPVNLSLRIIHVSEYNILHLTVPPIHPTAHPLHLTVHTCTLPYTQPYILARYRTYVPPRAHCITALMKLVAQNGSCPQRVFLLISLYKQSTSLDLHQR
jgi:hypothetical protein